MHLQHNDQPVKIVFKHVHAWDKGEKAPLPRPRVQAVTTCAVVGGTREEAVVLAEGHADCSSQDAFVRETGRRIALSRACEKLDTALQGKVKAAYYNRPRGLTGAPK